MSPKVRYLESRGHIKSYASSYIPQQRSYGMPEPHGQSSSSESSSRFSDIGNIPSFGLNTGNPCINSLWNQRRDAFLRYLSTDKKRYTNERPWDLWDLWFLLCQLFLQVIDEFLELLMFHHNTARMLMPSAIPLDP